MINFKLAYCKSYEDVWPTDKDTKGSEVVRFGPKCPFEFKKLVTVLYFLIILRIFYREGGSYTIDQHALEVLVYARYLRFLSVTWQRSICRRVEDYGTTSKFASIEFGM